MPFLPWGNLVVLRAMAIMYEAIKNDQNTLIVVPINVSEALDVKSVALVKAIK